VTEPRVTPNGSLELLEHIIEVTSADLDVHEVAQRVAALVTAATKSDVCFVHLVDEDLRRVVLAGATPPFDEQVGVVQLALGEGIAGWVALHGEPAVVPDKWKDRRYRYIPELRGEEFTSMVSVPMLVRGRVVGVLNVHSRAARNYGDGDLALMTQVANLMARAIENARLYQRLAEREETLERFATSTVEAQEMERRRLAGEIHDGISQRLVSLWYHLLAAEDALSGGEPTDRTGEPDRVRTELGTAKELATAALAEARAAIAGLRPFVLDDLGLGPGLESLGRTLTDSPPRSPGRSGPLALLAAGKTRFLRHGPLAAQRSLRRTAALRDPGDQPDARRRHGGDRRRRRVDRRRHAPAAPAHHRAPQRQGAQGRPALLA
jgi:signal transduction histidine kinase